MKKRASVAAVVAVATALVGFGLSAPARADLTAAHLVLNNFGTQQGWSASKHPRVLADITGDGRADIVGFGDAGVYTAIARGDGSFAMTSPSTVINDLGYNQGWRIGTNPRFVVDLNQDGKADIVGIGNAGVYTALSRGDGTFAPLTFASGDFGATNNQTFYTYVRDVNGDGLPDILQIRSNGSSVALGRGDGTFGGTFLANSQPTAGLGNIQVGDVNGDHRTDIVVSRGDSSLSDKVLLGQPNGTFSAPALAVAQSNAPIPFAVVDLTGDGRDDLLAYGGGGLVSALSRGDGTFTTFQPAVNAFGNNSTDLPIAVDITGDHAADLVDFGTAGTSSAFGHTDGTFINVREVVADFGSNQGWSVDSTPRVLADITGDGRADIVGFGNAGVFTVVASNDGTFH